VSPGFWQRERPFFSGVRAFLKTGDGEEIPPVDKVPPMVSATVEAMKKLMSAEGDEGSAAMHVLLFPTKTNAGKTIIDTSRKGKLTLALKADGTYNETVVSWRTPFDATTPVPSCAACKEPVSAKWADWAWCGASLENKQTTGSRR
jgi:hypothetical protein